ncbi:uncharacterized protein LOC111608325 [Xiphophorus maculatus]|uniref:Uncharacterized LOC111608325 n=1 Tax=Xiphophorus maculatus TaxID=8083 RepID=M4ASV2_XIPMA|nr:uncharacterized protein LOC111608325 [Xiphophorus maculatus]
MASFQLLVLLGYFATAQAAIDLDCFNDYDNIFCQLGVKECSQYTLIVDDKYDKYNCSLEKCNREHSCFCCCSTTFDPISGVYSVKVFEGVNEVYSKTFDVLESLKPKTPTIVSVDKTEGIFTVYWKTHMSDILDNMSAEVTIFKNGTQWKVPRNTTPATAHGLQSFQINSQDLEPDTNYTVSVRSYTSYSHKFSDRSKEFKFETSSAPNSLLLWIIISLSIFGVILIVSIYICFVKMKKKWWDSFSEPKQLFVPVRNPQFYKPHHEPTSPVWVKSLPSRDDDQMLPIKQREDGSVNGNSSGGSSDLCYGQTEPLEPKDDISNTINKALLECLSKHFTFSGPLQPPGPQDKMVPLFTSKKPSSVSSGIVNRSYFMSLSKSLDQSKEDSSTVEFPDNSINSCKSDTVDCPDQQIPAGLLSAQKDISSVVQVDMSYQQCKADANQTPLSENSSLSSTFSGTTTATSSGFDSSNASSFKRFDEANPDFLKMLFSSSLPSGTRHCPVVADDYKPFPNKVEQPGVLPSENQSIDHQGLNVIQGEKVLQTPQPFFIPDLKKWNGPSPSVLQIPHLTLLSSDKSAPVIVVDGYKCV